MIRQLRLGALDVRLVDDGEFRLDGGAMFGVVPRPLWERKKPADERNRIRMVTNCLLVERAGQLALVDTGIGDKNDAKFRDMFGMAEGAARLLENLEAVGVLPGDIDHVLLTHLHFDHCGWNTRENDAGEVVPTFPNARYWMARGEVEHAREPNVRDRASYDPRNWEPLFEAGLVELFDDRAEPLDGVEAIRCPGHNADMCIVRLSGGPEPEDTAIFWADLVPTIAHVSAPWIMGFDLYPMQTLENKEQWIPRAAEAGWLSIFEHETDTPVGRLVETRPGRFAGEPIEIEQTAGPGARREEDR